MLLRGFAMPIEADLIAALRDIVGASAVPPHGDAGRPSDVGGDDELRRAGWVTDRTGYRYDADDPETGKPWPEMPRIVSRASRAGGRAGGLRRFLRRMPA